MTYYNTDKRQTLARNTAVKQTLLRMGRGFQSARKDIRKLAGLLSLWTVLLSLWLARYFLFSYGNKFLALLADILLACLLVLLALALPAALCWAWGGPLQAGEVQDNLRRINFLNGAGEPPTLLSVTKSDKSRNVKIMEFFSIGLPLSLWLEQAEKIQAALNITVADLRHGEDHQHILLSAAPPATVLPKGLIWVDRLLSHEPFVLTLGVSVLGPVTIDLKKIPHILIGGTSGSGKTVLLKLMLHQAVQQGVEVHIADFKGGLDFGKWWRENCNICYELPDLLEMLGLFTTALKERRTLLQEADCANIDDYNELHPTAPLRRMIFACDEMAEVLDKKNRPKAEKEQVEQVIEALSTLARLGRASGLHLILATQRPDAELIPGQIRANLDARICGRANAVLSSIIIDNSSASTLIPKDAQGLFIRNDGGDSNTATVFQSFRLPRKLR